jgi:hypothetical protein
LNQTRCDRAALIASGSALILLWAYTPGDALPLCGFHWLTGYPCPFCGLTRGMCEMAKGNWQAAIEYHALSPLVFLMLTAMMVLNIWPRWKRISVPWAHVSVLFLGYGLGRAFLRNSVTSFFN